MNNYKGDLKKMRKQACKKCNSFQTIFIEELIIKDKKFRKYRCINCSEVFIIEVV